MKKSETRKKETRPGRKLVIGLPKGSLEETTVRLFRKAGLNLHGKPRSYYLSADDAELEVMLIRAQEIPLYVADGTLDMGFTGKDWLTERGSRVVEVAELSYAKSGLGQVKLVLAVPENSPIRGVRDLEGKRIATELVRVTQDYLKKNGVRAQVDFSWGATEIKAGKLCDAIAELTESGSTLRAHNLKIIDTIMVSTTRLVANPAAWKDAWKRRKIEYVSLLLQAALNAEDLVGLKLNVCNRDLKKIMSVLPALKNPTLSPLARPGWHALEVICTRDEVTHLIPRLKEAGAEGIVEYPLNRVVF
ncbi:MAG TPA: ATP phosphoribosyltransferase [bacterium]|nr:ATP phosphoribosyltransferase [bacterium]HNS48210.1 ATP phosphoribosyltransferase [bacterium]